MAATHGRCDRCPRISSLLTLTLLYVPPGMMRTVRLCAECWRVEKRRQANLKREVNK